MATRKVPVTPEVSQEAPKRLSVKVLRQELAEVTEALEHATATLVQCNLTIKALVEENKTLQAKLEVEMEMGFWATLLNRLSRKF